jgi:hypothetical protein
MVVWLITLKQGSESNLPNFTYQRDWRQVIMVIGNIITETTHHVKHQQKNFRNENRDGLEVGLERQLSTIPQYREGREGERWSDLLDRNA